MKHTYFFLQSIAVSDAIFVSNWWIQPNTKLRGGMLLAIARAQRPDRLTASGLFDVTLKSFTKVLNLKIDFKTLKPKWNLFQVIRTGWSVFSLMYASYSEEDT